MPELESPDVADVSADDERDYSNERLNRQIRRSNVWGSTGGGTVETEDHPHGGRLAGAVGAEEAGDNAWANGKGDVVDGKRAVVSLGQVMDFRATPACTLITEMWCARTSCSSRAIRSRSCAT